MMGWGWGGGHGRSGISSQARTVRLWWRRKGRRDAQEVPREQTWKGHHRERGLDRKEPGRELEELENEKDNVAVGRGNLSSLFSLEER